MRHEDEHDDEQKDEKDGPVGYGRPPKQTRFKKGQSGNPAGRPKGTLNLATILARILMEPVVVTEHGQKITMTKLEAVIKQLTHQAMSGELRASAQVVPLVQWMESQQDGPEPATELSEADQRVMARLLRRLTRQTKQGGGPHGSDADPN